LRALLARDRRRARPNPVAFLVHLAVPLLITGLIGMIFGGGGSSGGLGKIQFGIVDEDHSVLTQFLRGAVNQGQGGRYLQPAFLERAEAERQIAGNRLSAVVILPRGFTADYLEGTGVVTLELIKNPAQSFHPAIVEELLSALTTGLNAVARNFRPELNAWRGLLNQPDRPSARELGELVERTGVRFEAVREHLTPLRITYARVQEAPAVVGGSSASSSGPIVFAYMLPGLAAMFLLFIADTAIRDLYREQRFRTLDRYRTLRARLVVFVAAKGVYALVILAISGLILFGGGAVIFGIRWARPLELGVLVIAYAVFAVGFMSLISALAGTEKRADTLNTMAGMGLGLMGGCMFPPHQLPSVIRDHLTPWMPTRWFAAAAHGLAGETGSAWWTAAAALLVLGTVLAVVAAWVFQRRLERRGTV
jgi:ABC-type multidrug transport system permease subunit